jgi:PTS system nitrogen regulatory IIA component
MNLSVKDVAELLNVSEKTIYRMIKDETIPCFRVGGQWRFDQREIASWIEDTREFHYDAAKKGAAPEEESVSVTELLRTGGIYYNVAGEDRDAVIMSCIDRIRKTIPQVDSKKLFDAILDRENLCPTVIGNGIAFPHPRPFEKFTASLSSIVLCCLEKAIPFGALDNEDVDTLFFIFPKSERRFLRIQAKLSRLLKDDQVLSAVKTRLPEDELFTVFAMKEAEIFRAGAAA